MAGNDAIELRDSLCDSLEALEIPSEVDQNRNRPALPDILVVVSRIAREYDLAALGIDGDVLHTRGVTTAQMR